MADDQSSACSRTVEVVNNGIYEKTLCFVKYTLTSYYANKFCLSKGMLFYDRDSSPAAATTISQFVKNLVNGNKNAVVFVKGRKGKNCLVVAGNGKTRMIPCNLARTFACEYLKKGIFSLTNNQTNLIIS